MQQYLADLYPEIQFDKYSSVITFDGKYRPPLLVVETVNICNNECIFCAYSEQKRPKQIMEKAIFEKTILDYVAMGGGPVSFTPVVGDVFLDKRLEERVQFARQFPEITALSATTNAVMTYLKDEKALARILAQFNNFFISIYGMDEEEHFAITKKDTYQKMIEGIRRILNLFDGTLTFGFRLLKERTNEEITNWVAQLREGTSYAGPIGMGSTRTYLNWSVLDTSRPLPFGAFWARVPHNEVQCVLPLIACQVMSNGSVSFCSCPNFDDNEQLSIGNVRDDSLLDILNGEKSRSLWNWAQNGAPSFCQTCGFHGPMRAAKFHERIYNDPILQVGG